MLRPMSSGIITFALALAAVPPATDEAILSAEPQGSQGTTIIVTPPPTESERRQELRDFTKQIIRSPRLRQPVAKFLYRYASRCLALQPPKPRLLRNAFVPTPVNSASDLTTTPIAFRQ